jgi:hypothetical protein
VIDALLSADLPGVDPTRAALDRTSDLQAQEAAGGFTAEQTAPAAIHTCESLMTEAQAAARLGPKVMATLAAKFNGSVTEIRYPDEEDMLF